MSTTFNWETFPRKSYFLRQELYWCQGQIRWATGPPSAPRLAFEITCFKPTILGGRGGGGAEFWIEGGQRQGAWTPERRFSFSASGAIERERERERETEGIGALLKTCSVCLAPSNLQALPPPPPREAPFYPHSLDRPIPFGFPTTFLKKIFFLIWICFLNTFLFFKRTMWRLKEGGILLIRTEH